MANIKGPTFAKSSPHSSDEASRHDTPSTNLTAYSLGSAGTATGPCPKFNMNVAEADGPSFNISGGVGTSSSDPFFNLPTPTSVRTQLSPTADVFTPSEVNGPRFATSSVTNNASHFASGSAQSTSNGFPATHGRAQYGAVGDQPQLNNLSHGMQSLHINVEPQSMQYIELFRDGNLSYGTFTVDEHTTRALIVANMHKASVHHAVAQFSARLYPSVTGITGSSTTFVARFTNYRDAKAAYGNARKAHPEWQLERLSPKQYASRREHGSLPGPGKLNLAFVSNYEGEVIVSVFFNGNDDSLGAKNVFEVLQHSLSQFGDIKAFHSLPYQQANLREIRVEYYDTRHAENAARSLNMTELDSLVVSVEHHMPDVTLQDHTLPSVTGRSTVPCNDPAAKFGFGGGVYTGRPGNDRGRNGRSDASGNNHNQVEIFKIQHGMDVRTTIMLRNIPNKVTQAILKMILDETSFGRYDFMYLRIDFANNCNVGYAFINFVDALAIIPFALARAGQRWNRFNSDKVAEISYATIQGKDCLVQKFRNSSVMLECPTFRPKLYVTGNVHDAGEEEAFPPPDNPSKMRRSVENAEHVGLFAPRQGQMYREEQRRRRSNYDRGTPGAEYEAHTQHLSDPALSAYPSSSSYQSYYDAQFAHAPEWYLHKC